MRSIWAVSQPIESTSAGREKNFVMPSQSLKEPTHSKDRRNISLKNPKHYEYCQEVEVSDATRIRSHI